MAYPIDVPYVIATHVRKYLSSSRLIAKARAGALGMVNGILYFNNGTTVAPIGGTGIAPLHQAVKVLNNAEILALPSVSQELVALPGLDKVILPQYAAVRCNYLVGVSPNGGSDYLTIGTGVDDQEEMSVTFPSSSGDRIFGFVPAAQTTVVAGLLSPQPLTVSHLNNAPLTISVSASADSTGGDPTNVMTVSVTYLVLDLTTGLFE